jgi:MFS family permease
MWTLANAGAYLAMFAVTQVLLPKRAAAISGAADKVGTLSWASALGAGAGMVAAVVTGVLSDRTIGRRGRRHPWIGGGAVVAGLGLVIMGSQTTAAGLVVAWTLASLALGAMTAGAAATVPDEVPESQRGVVSAWGGIAIAAGPLVGIALVALVITTAGPAFAVLAAIVVGSVVPFVVLTRGTVLPVADRPRFSWSTLWVSPRRYPDFAWAWVGRFLIQLSNALGLTYLYFFLQDRLRQPNPAAGVLILTVVYTVCVVVAALWAGCRSDRTGRRKRIVMVSSILQGLAGLILAVVPTWSATVVAAAVLGVGFGAYSAASQALITLVLPAAEHRGKDIGIQAIANVLPVAAAPAMAGPIIGHAGGYPMLYFLVLVTALLAAGTVRPIRSVA